MGEITRPSRGGDRRGQTEKKLLTHLRVVRALAFDLLQQTLGFARHFLQEHGELVRVARHLGRREKGGREGETLTGKFSLPW